MQINYNNMIQAVLAPNANNHLPSLTVKHANVHHVCQNFNIKINMNNQVVNVTNVYHHFLILAVKDANAHLVFLNYSIKIHMVKAAHVHLAFLNFLKTHMKLDVNVLLANHNSLDYMIQIALAHPANKVFRKYTTFHHNRKDQLFQNEQCLLQHR